MTLDTLRLALGNVSLSKLRVPSFLVIDALQHTGKDVQLASLALTLTIICRTLGIDPHELVSMAKRQLARADTVRDPHIEAIADYAAGELK